MDRGEDDVGSGGVVRPEWPNENQDGDMRIRLGGVWSVP